MVSFWFLSIYIGFAVSQVQRRGVLSRSSLRTRLYSCKEVMTFLQSIGTVFTMTRDQFNMFCASLKATTHVVQWGNADVWKLGGKVFALCGWHEGEPAFTFKVTPLAYEILPDQPGVRPAPYLASRGMKWVQVYEPKGMSDVSLQEHIVASYDMIRDKLTKKLRAELGV